MDVHTNIPLKNYLTMRIGGNARFMAEIHNPNDIPLMIKNVKQHQLSIFVLGGGSNTLARDEGYDGIVLLNRIRGIDILNDTPEQVVIKVGAGESWDEFVKRTVEMGLTGVECLSAIPGTVGAAPVQNIGAYGQEVSETIMSLEAYDMKTDEFISLSNEMCHFTYRSSIFREESMGRYIITSVTFHLYHSSPQPPFYRATQEYLDAHNITIYTPQVLRDAVTAIRRDKLPDPTVKPNTGSFFKNAIIEDWQYDELTHTYPDMPSYDMPDGHHKIPSGWLIEQAGLKGQLLHGMRVHDKNALVLINESAKGYADLAAAREEVIGAVRDKFRIQIEQEPLEIPEA